MTIRMVRAGDRGLLLIPEDHSRLAELAQALRADPDVQDALPAAETVLVEFRPGVDVDKAGERLAGVEVPVAAACDSSSVLEVQVRYDGADLAEAACLLGISRAELVAAHSGIVWRCAFVGFAPGFGYLESPDWPYRLPRRDRPRTDVPAGAVALAAGYSAVYPRATPGGWQLIGRTELPVFDLDRDPPALLSAGCPVRFTPEGDSPR